MRLVFSNPDASARAVLLALQLTGADATRVTSEVPLVILELDSRDLNGNVAELMGDLAIVHHLLSKGPTPPDHEELELAEWIAYIFSPIAGTVNKDSCKTDTKFLEALTFIESKLTSKFIGGSAPSTADLLAFTRVHSVMSGNVWLGKRYTKLTAWFNALQAGYEPVLELLGEKAAAPVKKSKGGAVVFAEEVRLHRVPGPIPLPDPSKRNVLITSALPYVNNVPHLGNLIGCVLSADVFARFSRLRGYNTLYVCGTDEYGTATETAAMKEGVTPKELCDKYFQVHKRIYEWLNIDFDYFGRTTTPAHTEIAQNIFLSLNEAGLLHQKDIEQSYCDTCSRFLADRYVKGKCPHCGSDNAKGDQCEDCSKLLDPFELINPQCFLCLSTPQPRTSRHVFIDLPNIKDRLEAWVDESSQKGDWSHNAITTTKAWIRDGLTERCITRDLKWGTPVPIPELSNKVFYVWFDAPIGYISITANLTSEWERWWKNSNVELVQFMGKDNVPFHTVVFPCSLLGTGQDWTLLSRISTTEYLNYEGGKFSKSRGIGVFGDNAQNTGIPPEVWRYYLLSLRPETSDSMFKWKDFADRNNNELLANLGNFANRILKFLEKYGSTVPAPNEITDADRAVLDGVYAEVLKYSGQLEDLQLKGALSTAMYVSSLCNKYLQDEKLWTTKQDNPRFNTVLFVALNLLRLTVLLFEPYMPSFSAKLYAQLALQRTERDETLLKEVVEANSSAVLTSLLVPGHVIGTPAPVFRRITDDEVNSFKAQFSGKQVITGAN
mmetsp:Transcript_1094/g.2681  ORF Transcript_1094/g.2681 Transcript_1094/m.2681 type:complete len:778 (+) Transcript_1094:1902-4235(+)